MKLVPAEGNLQLQRALAHIYVTTLVDIFVHHLDTLMVTADVLQTLVIPNPPGLKEKLKGIYDTYRSVDGDGNITVPEHIAKLIETLEKLYHQRNNEIITDQRGAIVELLARRLICPRYTVNDICANSRRFEDEQGREITIQEVDVAALSDVRRHVEAYECKMRSNKLERSDCDDLQALVQASEQRGYRANVGVISFDVDEVVRKKLRRLDAPYYIKPYGLQSIGKLQRTPFD
jgi:hypothetical protein